MQIYFTGLWYNCLFAACWSGWGLERVCCGSLTVRMWLWRARTCTVLSHTKRWQIMQRLSIRGFSKWLYKLKVFQSRTSRQRFCLHSFITMSQAEEKKFCLLWLCLFYRETNVMHGQACKYEARLVLPIYKTRTFTFFYSFVRTSDITINCLRCMTNF